MSGENLVAVCGLYCGACEMYRADHDDNEQKSREMLKQFSARFGKLTLDQLQCDGCLGEGNLTPWCSQCAIRLCPNQKTGVTRCSDCADFPCSRITDFNNDGMQHHAEVLENLRCIRQTGIKKWAKSEEDRWRCPSCQTELSWYDKACPHCGAARSRRLFALKQE
jgi:hypothetical protein